MAINFFCEDVDFNLPQKLKRKQWLKKIMVNEKTAVGELNYIFCSDEYLHKINIDYLNHDTYTDIITFDNSEIETKVEGDIFISIDRVKENAITHNISEEKELSRVISHGLLHLLGYKDKSKEEALEMRSKEEEAIQLFDKI
jgi:probable rRNA maturation factor